MRPFERSIAVIGCDVAGSGTGSTAIDSDRWPDVARRILLLILATVSASLNTVHAHRFS